MASPCPMGTIRRAGIAAAAAAAPLGLAYRFALAYRVRAGYPRPNPPHVTPDDLGLPYETTTVRSGDLDLPAWFIPARDGAPGPGLVLVHGWEVGPRSDAPNGGLPACGRVPLPDLRRPRARGQAAREPAHQRRRVRRRRAGRLRGPARPTRGDGRRDRRPLDGRYRRDPGCRRGPARGSPGRDVVAGRSVPAHSPDLPPGPAAHPGPDRLSARLAHDPRLPPTARARRARDRRAAGDRAVSRAGPARPRRRGPRRAGGTWAAGHGRPIDARGRAGRRPVETLLVDGGPALVAVRVPRLPPGGRAVRRAGARRSADPEAAGDIAAATPAERIPDGEARFAAVDETPRRNSDAGPGRPPWRDPAAPPRPGRASSGDPRRDRSGLGGDPDPSRDPSFEDRPLDGPPRADPAAGRRSGSSKNLQRWAFIVCRDRAHLRELSNVGPFAGHLAGAAVGDRPRHARSTAGAPRCRSRSTSGRPPRT